MANTDVRWQHKDGRLPRETVCWSCGQSVNDVQHKVCPACGWIICPACGACRGSKDGRFDDCVGVRAFDYYGRQILRDIWLNLPEPRTDISDWVHSHTTDDCKNLIQQEKERRSQIARRNKEAETREANERLIALRDSAVAHGVKHLAFGHGRVSKWETDASGNVSYLTVVFDGGKTAQFVFPQAFTDGFLSLE